MQKPAFQPARPVSSVGIAVCETDGNPPFADREFYAQLCRFGWSEGLSVYVFSPGKIDSESGLVDGYTYSDSGWQACRFPLPGVVYDRCFYRNSGEAVKLRTAMAKGLGSQSALFLGAGLRGKYEVNKTLCEESDLAPYLPESERYSGPRRLLERLRRTGAVFLKPEAGTHGLGAVKIEPREVAAFRVTGRDGRNREFVRELDSSDALARWADAFVGSRRYILQPYLQLTGKDGTAFDVRSLVQKDGSGRWSLTGMAVRLAGPGSVTANLHGGGRALELLPFLQEQFGEPGGSEIARKLAELSSRIPPALESRFGRLAELGLDFGVDRNGRIWFIEANSKPGRAAFRALSDPSVRTESLRRPMAYARYLLNRNRPFAPFAPNANRPAICRERF